MKQLTLPAPIKRHPVIASIVGVLLLVLVFSGGDDTPAERNFTEDDIKLHVEPRSAAPYTRLVKVYGQTEAIRDVLIQAQTSGEVAEVVAGEGTALKTGDTILRIAPRERTSRLLEAKAAVRQREIEYEAARKLNRQGYQSKTNLALASTNLKQAKAQLEQVQLDIDFTDVKAPFDGVIERINVEEGDFIGVGVFGLDGAPARMIDPDPMQVTAFVSQTDRPHLQTDATVEVLLPDGSRREGELRFVAMAAETASRTFRVEVAVPNADYSMAAGMTATLHLPAQQVQGYFVPPSVLALDDAGNVGVKALDDDNRVQFYPVEITGDTQDAVHVSGLPERLRLITRGQAWVSPGQTIPQERIVLKVADEESGQ